MSETGFIFAFWALAALAVVGALAFVLPVLWRNHSTARDRAARREINLALYREQMKDLKAELSESPMSQEQFLANKLELETRAAADALVPEEAAPAPVASRRLGFALAGVLPIAAFGMYFWLGNPAVVTAIARGESPVAAAEAPTPEDIQAMVQQIEARTQADPNNGAAWEALAMAQALLSRWPEALQAYKQAHRLLPDKPSVMVGYAESLGMNNNQVLSGLPIELVGKALQAEPGNTKALELSVIHAYQTQNYARAIELLDRLGKHVEPDSPYAREVLAMRADAQRRLQGGPGAVANAVPPAEQAPTSAKGPGGTDAGRSISGRVELAEPLKARVGAQYTVFVLARAGEGGPPLAAVRAPMGPLPLSFNLNDSLAMIPGNVLSKHKDVMLVARISASGNPIAQPGDLEGRLAGVAVGAKDVRLLVDRVLP
jgi:cytochrome c-type biogenesis protein CcmH